MWPKGNQVGTHLKLEVGQRKEKKYAVLQQRRAQAIAKFYEDLTAALETFIELGVIDIATTPEGADIRDSYGCSLLKMKVPEDRLSQLVEKGSMEIQILSEGQTTFLSPKHAVRFALKAMRLRFLCQKSPSDTAKTIGLIPKPGH